MRTLYFDIFTLCGFEMLSRVWTPYLFFFNPIFQCFFFYSQSDNAPPNKAPHWYKDMYKQMHTSMEGKRDKTLFDDIIFAVFLVVILGLFAAKQPHLVAR